MRKLLSESDFSLLTNFSNWKPIMVAVSTVMFLAMSVDCKAQELESKKIGDFWSGLSVGYVNKYWRTDFDDKIVRENYWGEEGKKIHGLQLGLSFEPCLKIGLGLHTGLFYEYYMSYSKTVKDFGADDFTEHNLYLPLHGLFRIPVTKKFVLTPFGGLGFNWAFAGSYHAEEDEPRQNVMELLLGMDESYHSYTVKRQTYGNGQWPRRFNVQWEIGCNVGLRIPHDGIVQLRFTYSRGLTNHNLYTGYETKQNKIGISIGVWVNAENTKEDKLKDY